MLRGATHIAISLLLALSAVSCGSGGNGASASGSVQNGIEGNFSILSYNVAGLLEGLGSGVDNLENTLGAGVGPHHEAVEVAEPLQGLVEHPDEGDERHELSQRELIPQHLLAAKVPNEEHAEAHEEVGHHDLYRVSSDDL